MWGDVIINVISTFIFSQTKVLGDRTASKHSLKKCRNAITGTQKNRKTFFKDHVNSASETASSTTKESNFLECTETDAAELVIDGDSADCFWRGLNDVLQVFF